METDRTFDFAKFLHDLRTPLNQIIGFTEMLMEEAEETGELLLLEELRGVRHAGVNLVNLLQNDRLFSVGPKPDGRSFPLDLAIRAPLSRILGYTELFLQDTSADDTIFRPDLQKIQQAAQRMHQHAHGSGVYIALKAEWIGNECVVEETGAADGGTPLHGRVLVVDDEVLNCEMLCRRLVRQGCDPVGVGSGDEALVLLHREAFDAVLLDIQMPGLSGIEVLQAIKEDAHLRALPVIMLSAHTDVERIARCLELGAEDFLPKPVDNVVLRARLGASLQKRKMAEELLHAGRLQSIGFLAGGLAHDYNNMLAAVLGNLSILRFKGALSEDLLPLVREAERGAERAQELTRYLLTFADGGAPVKQKVDLATLLEEVCGPLFRGTSMKLHRHLAQDLWEVEADPDQVAQVVTNLVRNALEASAAESTIAIRAENVTAPVPNTSLPAGPYLRVEVEDHGCGISREDRPHVFDPFFTTKDQARGLGLATAYSILQRHGGEIILRSTPGVGTTATFYLPARAAAAAPVQLERTASPAAGKPASADAARKPRVLVMDDEEPIRLLAETMLELLEYEVVAVPDGDSALVAHASAREAGQPFDYAVMDLNIPGGMGGAETMRRLREIDSDIRTIVASGYSNDPVMANHKAYGFDAVLPKPYVMNDLIRILESLQPQPS